MPRRARRILLSLFLWLLLGAAVNVLVAWLSIFVTRDDPWWAHDADAPLPAVLRFGTSADGPPIIVNYHATFWHEHAFGFAASPRTEQAPGDPLRPSGRRVYLCAGVPFRSLLGWVPSTNYFSPAAARFKSPVLWVIRPGPPTASGNLRINDGLFLPLRPLWPGFALNAAFYALIAFLFTRFVATPTIRSVRHHLRARRGHCPQCRYDLRGRPPTSPCPECGHATPTNRAR